MKSNIEALKKVLEIAKTSHLQAIDEKMAARVELLLAKEIHTKADSHMRSLRIDHSNATGWRSKCDSTAEQALLHLTKVKTTASKDVINSLEMAYKTARENYLQAIDAERIAEFEVEVAIENYRTAEAKLNQSRINLSKAEEVECKADREAETAFNELAKAQLKESGKVEFSTAKKK